MSIRAPAGKCALCAKRHHGKSRARAERVFAHATRVVGARRGAAANFQLMVKTADGKRRSPCVWRRPSFSRPLTTRSSSRIRRGAGSALNARIAQPHDSPPMFPLSLFPFFTTSQQRFHSLASSTSSVALPVQRKRITLVGASEHATHQNNFERALEPRRRTKNEEHGLREQANSREGRTRGNRKPTTSESEEGDQSGWTHTINSTHQATTCPCFDIDRSVSSHQDVTSIQHSHDIAHDK